MYFRGRGKRNVSRFLLRFSRVLPRVCISKVYLRTPKLKGIELTSPQVRAMHEHVGSHFPPGVDAFYIGSVRSFEQGL